METSQTIQNFALNVDFYIGLIRATFEVLLKLNTATLFKRAYCIASFIVFECFEFSWSQKFSKIEHKLQEKRQT